MERYDLIIIGAGASGLSLACHLAASPLRDRRILIVEQALQTPAPRTWAFWDTPATRLPFGELAFHSWSRLQVATPRRTLVLRPHPYRYHAIHSRDFYPAARARLAACAHLAFREGTVSAVGEAADGAWIRVDGEQYMGHWVFDSRFALDTFHPPPRYHYLRMQVRGWEIETDRPAFDPRIATFLDFRTPQPARAAGGGLRFLYVLPTHEQRALVEHVACVPAAAPLLPAPAEEQALRHYIAHAHGVTGYRVVGEEQGVNPLVDYPFPRRPSPHVMTIGIAGGQLKPSTGFAFARIQRDSAAIVRALQTQGQPFAVPSSGWIYRLGERIMLGAMARHGPRAGAALDTLFRVGATPRILRFLDEEGLPF